MDRYREKRGSTPRRPATVDAEDLVRAEIAGRLLLVVRRELDNENQLLFNNRLVPRRGMEPGRVAELDATAAIRERRIADLAAREVELLAVLCGRGLDHLAQELRQPSSDDGTMDPDHYDYYPG